MTQNSENKSQRPDSGRQNSAGYGFVPLDRTFHELSPHARDGDEFDLSEALHVRGNLSWAELLENYRTVILSEAGSGKTEEIRQTALGLLDEGKLAFFLRLEHVPTDFDDAFEVGSLSEFEAWLKSESEAWLFLDSVDEARLKSPIDFALAIRKLGNRIKLATQRTHIVITGRMHAWRAKSDPELCEAHLPYGSPVQTVAQVSMADFSADEDEEEVKTATQKRDEPVFKIVALDDLGRDQIKKFAFARGVTNTKEFLDDLERADAWSFTARPQDLQEVIGFWLEKRRIGTRLEIMKASIDRRLAERSQDRADAFPLSPDKARRGARLAAAATTMGHNPTIQIPDGTENKTGIPLQDVLSDWDGRDRSTLLSYPIFDEAIYATVRFHHRSVREYLAAEWLAELLKGSVSRREVESLLFHNQYGIDVVRPTLRPVLPWLAILDAKVRKRLQAIAPEILFEGGDPSSLPVETRREILSEMCEQIASGMAGWGATSYSAVQRFANHDIAKDIRALLQKHSSNDELRGFLVRMIWLGRLKELLPEATEISLSSVNSRHTRIAAFRAVIELGGAQAAQDLRKHFFQESSALDREWLAELISDTEPTREICDWFLACLAKAEPKEEFSVDRLANATAEFIQKADIELVPALMSGISKLLDDEPFIERAFCHVSRKHAWLLSAAAAGAQRLIETRHAFALDDVTLRLLFNLRIGKEWYNELRDSTPGFPDLFAAWPGLNRAAFWHDVRESRRRMLNRPGDRLTYYGQASVFGAFWSFKADDFDYVCEQIAAQTEPDNKLVALSLAFDLYVKEGRTPDWRRRLKRAVGDNADLKQRLATLLQPPARDDSFRKQEQKWKRQAAARRRRDKINYEKSKDYLLKHVDQIRDQKFSDPAAISNPQWYLHERLREKSNSRNTWTGGNWIDLVPEYGNDVARAYRDAVVTYWRKNKAVLRSEGATPNSVPMMVIFGLTGLAIEASETPDWSTSLTEDEVALACRYACHELNGFPSWFPKLFNAWPNIAGACLMREIAYELTVETAEQETHYVLSDVSWSGQWAWQELGPQIYKLLEKSNPQNSGTLSKLVKIVEGSNVSDADLAKLAARKATDPASTHAPLWYAAWVGVEPEKAIPTLKAYLAALPTAQTQFAIQFVTRLFGSRRSETTVARPGFHTPDHLKTLYLLMHQYIRRDEDIERAGKGVYSPGPRDDAQEARSKLFDALNKLSGKAAFLAMQEITQNHPDGSSRGWLMRLTRQKAEQDSELDPWTPSQVRDFNDKLDRTPKNHRELAEVAVLRLLDLKDDLENGDASVAAIVQRVERETEMRNYIARELREKSSGRYNIPQEDELADAKRPDLRFLGFGFEGAVPAELKLADANWSGRALFERLENQLAGDYLRDIHSGQGIFVLVNRGGKKKNWEHPETQKALNFDELTEALRAHWSKISPKFPNVDGITVIGIDLSKRSKPPLTA